MKRIYLIIFLIFSYININAQNITFGWNTCLGAGIGYQYIHNEKLHSPINPKHMIAFDANVFGIYLGFGYGNQTIYEEKHDWYDIYTERINVYTYKIGPSVKIGNYKYKLTLTPYIGGMHFKYSEGYYDYEREYEFERYFIYGGKASLIINCVELGVNVSNIECGFSLGFNLGM